MPLDPAVVRLRRPCVELRIGDALTVWVARAVAEVISNHLHGRPAALWLNLESVKIVDAVGLAVLAQAIRRAERLDVAAVVFPSAVVYQALVRARLHQHLALDKRRAWQRDGADAVVCVEAQPELAEIVSATVRLTPAAWHDLEQLEAWARDESLHESAASELLLMCREKGAYDPDFVAEATASPTSITFLIRPRVAASPPMGFVRMHKINAANGFAFLEIVGAPARPRCTNWDIEASRLISTYAVDVLRLHRLEMKVSACDPPSANALEHAGFRLECRLREAWTLDSRPVDVLVFGILESEVCAQRTAAGLPPMGLWPDEPA